MLMQIAKTSVAFVAMTSILLNSRSKAGSRQAQLIGWFVALTGGVLGLFLSFHFDLPSGAAIVCTFGVLLVVVTIAASFRRIGK